MAYNYFQSANPYMGYNAGNYIPQQQYVQQPQVQQPFIYGKIVDGIDVVKAVDVPVGSTYILPKADGTFIYSKGWNVDGTTFIKEYKLTDQNLEKELTINWEEKLNDLYDLIDELSQKIDRIKSSTTTTRKRKTEVDEDE